MYMESNDPDCSTQRAYTPMLELHGTDDTTAPYGGGNSHKHALPKVREALSHWATRNGCGDSPKPSVDEKILSPTVFHTQYDCQGIEGLVIGYNVTGQKHWWIADVTNDENGGDHSPIDGSTIMMEFFALHSLPDSEEWTEGGSLAIQT
jgi:poly(3-hydroxybutyrate) depolymerase